ncbi:MAG: HAMP domain-containing protein [Planctomycetaceae bacterium]|nr:HAMP domain-containing protein [Planctomycetaceae bacterium]
MRLSQKITLMIGGLVLVSLLALSTIVFLIQQATNKSMIVAELAERRDAARMGFTSYLESIDQDLNLWASLPLTRDALGQFSEAWTGLGQSRASTLQRLYIAENPNPLGEKDKLEYALDGSGYSDRHRQYHPSFNSLKDERGYYDVFLIDPDGNIIYTVYKELDYATNLMDGEFADSGLGAVFRAAKGAAGNSTAFVDFAPYEPSYGAPASFIAKRVEATDGTLLGVIAFQMPIDRLAALVGDLGHGTYAMVVGDDRLLRNEDARFGEGSILTQKIPGTAVSEAIGGTTGEYSDSRDGTRYLQAAAPLEFHGTTWAFVAETSEHLAFSPVRHIRNTMFFLALACLAVSIAVALWLARSISRPIASLSSVLRSVADGDLNVAVPYSDRRDEIGGIATSIDHFIEQNAKMEALKKQGEEIEERERATLAEKQQAESEAQRREIELAAANRSKNEDQRQREIAAAQEIAGVVDACAMGDFTKRLGVDGKDGVFLELSRGINRISEITNEGLKDISAAMAALSSGDLTFRIDGDNVGIFGKITDDVNESMEGLIRIVNGIRDSTVTTNLSVDEISAAADTLAGRTESNAATLEETHAALVNMAEAVKQSTTSTSSAGERSSQVVQETQNGIRIVEEAVAAIQQVKESSGAIAKIVDLIEGIAFQTNLLALNAGVEAARAGESGRGFSVVATEVRALAARSTKAAKDISEIIADSEAKVENGVQLTGQSARVLEGIAVSVREVASQIGAVEKLSKDQNCSIEEIKVASNHIEHSTQENAAMFEETNASIQTMKTEFSSLLELVDTFKLSDGAVAEDWRAVS